MKLKDLKKGDKIWVKCPISSEIWQEEIITKIDIAEDGYVGSGWWFMRIFTDKCSNQVKDEEVIEGKHWPILIHRIGESTQYRTDANYRNEMIVSAEDPIGIATSKYQPSLIEIIQQSVLVDLSKKEPLPQEKVSIVGMSNDKWECHTFFNLRYTTHDESRYTYGGDQWFDKEGNPQGWWLMNHNYANFRKEYMFIVPDRDCGDRLAKLLNMIGNDWLDTTKAISIRKKKIKELQREIDTINEVENYLHQKPFKEMEKYNPISQ